MDMNPAIGHVPPCPPESCHLATREHTAEIRRSVSRSGKNYRKMKSSIYLTLLLLHTSNALAAEYWVSTAGSDANSGSREQPFLTLQQAADTMRPGDTCVVRGGRYRQPVCMRRSGTSDKPIRLMAAVGERVTLDGTDLVKSKWTRYRENIYRTAVEGPVEQVFVDGAMQIEARWPNMRFEEIWDRTKWARSDHRSCKDRLVCEALAETGVDWTGALATLNVGHQYKTWTRDVTSHTKGDDQFTYELNERLGDGRDSGPSWADDYFYLSGKLEGLDAPTEWYYDAGSGTLYLWCEDGGNPATHEVAIKRRTYALDASQHDYLQIVGFHFFAATLRLNNCNHCLVDQCRLRFAVYGRRFEQRTRKGKRLPEPTTLVAGDHNIIRNSSVAFSSLGGLLVRGRHCRVENCVIHDVNWGGSYSHPGLLLQGSSDVDNHNVVSRSTVYGVGNIGILSSGRANTVEYNHVFDTGRACRDIAAVHTGGVGVEGSVTHHNWVHDSTGLGLRGDDQTRGLTFHHNVVWNCRRGMIIKGDRNRVYHNTVLIDPEDAHATASIIIPKRAEPKKWWTTNPTLPVQNEDTQVFNNAAYLISDHGGTPIPTSDRVSHNVILSGNLRGQFIDAGQQALDNGTFDLRPAPGSSLIDAGHSVPNATMEFQGQAPDVGAYEAGGERWVAGADWQDEPIDVSMIVRLEPPRTRHSIPLPARLLESEISSKGLRRLQKLCDELWARGDRVLVRKNAIALRQRYPEGSPEHQRYHAIVARLHREVTHLLEDRGIAVLDESDGAVFRRTMSMK